MEAKHETVIQTAKAAPAIAGAVAASITLNEVVAIVTIIYVVLQGAYLIWKWVREAKNG